MAEISTNIILDGITLALRSAFPGSHIESNAVKQGLRQPAFIVLLVNAEVTDYPAQRKKRLPRFDVLYFPRSGREDCYGVECFTSSSPITTSRIRRLRRSRWEL